MDKRKMINKMTACIEGGKAVAAAYLGMSENGFNNRLYESKGSRFFSVDELEALQKLSNTRLVADYFAARSGAIVVPLPDGDALDSVELHHLSLQTSALRGFVDKTTIESIENGGAIDSEERKRILEAHKNYLIAREHELRSILKLYGAQELEGAKAIVEEVCRARG